MQARYETLGLAGVRDILTHAVSIDVRPGAIHATGDGVRLVSSSVEPVVFVAGVAENGNGGG